MDAEILEFVTKLYFHKDITRNIPESIKNRVKEITKSLPEGLLEDSETNGFQFGRAARRALGMPFRGFVAESEKRNAIVDVLIYNMSYKEALAKYGIPDRTLRDYFKIVANSMGLEFITELRTYVMANDVNKEVVRNTVWNMEFASPGRPYDMNRPELDAMAHYSFSASEHGSRYGRAGMAVSSMVQAATTTAKQHDQLVEDIIVSNISHTRFLHTTVF
jgi:hypothetical protein